MPRNTRYRQQTRRQQGRGRTAPGEPALLTACPRMPRLQSYKRERIPLVLSHLVWGTFLRQRNGYTWKDANFPGCHGRAVRKRSVTSATGALMATLWDSPRGLGVTTSTGPGQRGAGDQGRQGGGAELHTQLFQLPNFKLCLAPWAVLPISSGRGDHPCAYTQAHTHTCTHQHDTHACVHADICIY